jgi:hypothetical protein
MANPSITRRRVSSYVARSAKPLNLAVLIIAAGAIMVAVALSQVAAKSPDLWLEVGKAGLQAAVVGGLGLLVKVVLDDRDARREERQRAEFDRLRMLDNLVGAYNQAKATRRILRALGFRRPPAQGTPIDPFTPDQLAEFDRQMRSLNQAQLDLEVVARTLAVRSPAIAGVDLGKELATVQKYLGRVLKDWELRGPALAATGAREVLDSMSDFQDFVAQAHGDGGANSRFSKEAATPLRRIEEAIRTASSSPTVG